MADMTGVEPTVEPVPTIDDIVAVSQEAQLLCEPMFVMTTFPGDVGMAAVMAEVRPHLDYWAEMERENVLFAGGPVMSKDGPDHGSDPWSGHGFVIFRAQSLAAAHAIADADPMHKVGARDYELRPWLLNHLVLANLAER